MTFEIHPSFEQTSLPARPRRPFRALFTASAFLLAAACAGGCVVNNTTSGTNTAGDAGAGGDTGGSGGTGGAGGADAAPAVETPSGKIEGFLDGSTRRFLGIPYAEPPVGDLRWKPPVKLAPWMETLVATKKGASCTQNNPLNGQLDAGSAEDCLFLNVWTPENPASGALPVLVWIHGGGFVFGSGGEPAYDGRIFSEATGAVVVTINYRLGPTGFLALPELKTEDAGHPATGNYGLMDQRLALEWVKENIAAFGGDPGNVTIFGESAGGISTCLHMVSPKSSGFFHRAIIQSGPCDKVDAEDDAMAQGSTFVDALGCKGDPDVLACLRAKPIEDVMAALPTSADFLGGDVSWFPIVDGVVIPAPPLDLLAAGTFEKVPVITGSNADEATLFLALAQTTIADDVQFEMLAESLVPGKGAEIVGLYPSSTYGSSQAAAAAAVGDAGFVCPSRRQARAFAAAGAPAYLYHFTYNPGSSLLGDLGAFHSSEIKFVLGNPGQLIPAALTDEEKQMSQTIMAYWSRLATTGDPNGGETLMWPKYSEGTDENLVIDMTFSTQTGLRKELCDFWDNALVGLP
jgi:para-nitrobenzyl esterase